MPNNTQEHYGLLLCMSGSKQLWGLMTQLGCAVLCSVLNCAGAELSCVHHKSGSKSAGKAGHRLHLDPGRMPVSASVVHGERHMSVLVGTLQPYVTAHQYVPTEPAGSEPGQLHQDSAPVHSLSHIPQLPLASVQQKATIQAQPRLAQPSIAQKTFSSLTTVLWAQTKGG